MIGPDSSGNLPEVVVVPIAEPTRIIHADRLRPTFRRRVNAVMNDDNEGAEGRDRT